jgi:hypothetical protein
MKLVISLELKLGRYWLQSRAPFCIAGMEDSGIQNKLKTYAVTAQ